MKTSSKYYVVELGGKQHLVCDGDTITSERIGGAVGRDFEIDKVLLSVDGGKVNLGKPYLKASVSATLINNFLGPKVRVAKFKAKTGYRRVNGYRASLSEVKINHIA